MACFKNYDYEFDDKFLQYFRTFSSCLRMITNYSFASQTVAKAEVILHIAWAGYSNAELRFVLQLCTLLVN